MAIVKSDLGPKLILVVDGETSVVDAVAKSLRYEGFDVDTAATGQAALASALERPPDLTVLSATLPDCDGPEVARRLQALGVEAPVLFLVPRDLTRREIAGLSIGADECVSKPFALAEIVVRTRAILDRNSGGSQKNQPLRFADVEMDESIREVRRAGVPIPLNAMEYNLLRFFLLHPHRVLSKTEIMDHVWRYDFHGDTSLVESHVARLRQKLDPYGPPLIHTVRRAGYILRDARTQKS
jgi:two-component system OmpR family response regulator